MTWLDALILGIVQGITEFLPISSDGHLRITQGILDHFGGRVSTGEENLFFVVMVHLGTLAAILIYYRNVGFTAARGLLGESDVPAGFDRASVIQTCAKVVVATLPAVYVGLRLKKKIEAAFASLSMAGLGFLITGVVLLVTLRLKGGEKGPARMTYLDALLIGLAQAFAPLPGVSRSGLTIAAALALGLNRTWAVGFSLLMAVPVIAGAGVLEIRHIKPAMLAPEVMGPTVFAAVVAGVVGYFAISALVAVARSGRIWYFSVYLFVLGTAVLIFALSRPRALILEKSTSLWPARATSGSVPPRRTCGVGPSPGSTPMRGGSSPPSSPATSSSLS